MFLAFLLCVILMMVGVVDYWVARRKNRSIQRARKIWQLTIWIAICAIAVEFITENSTTPHAPRFAFLIVLLTSLNLGCKSKPRTGLR